MGTVATEIEYRLPRLLTPPQAFRELQLSPAKGWQMVASGELPSLKIGRARRIRVDDLEAFIEARLREDAASR
jgi:excisionase family DNA binding protein